MRLNRFAFDKISTNQHGTQKAGEPWNGETVKGWKIIKIKLTRGRPGISVRFILYFPSGSWWNLDYYSKGKIW